MPLTQPVLAEHPRPLLFAHRGLNRSYLENSIEAFRAARAAGIPGIELDVHLTADNQLVVFHDDDTGRIDTRLRDTPLADIAPLSLETSSLDQLRTTAAGRSMPLLDELFEEFGTDFYYDIELKSRSAADTGLGAAVAECIRHHNLGSHCVVSLFNPFALRYFR
ncbi:MAG: glycerophosphodiester phosphodiesterase, partial [Rectinema sp.]|nr:glycerophosphodiester phosphodiesterase [Rectinema sp.]